MVEALSTRNFSLSFVTVNPSLIPHVVTFSTTTWALPSTSPNISSFVRFIWNVDSDISHVNSNHCPLCHIQNGRLSSPLLHFSLHHCLLCGIPVPPATWLPHLPWGIVCQTEISSFLISLEFSSLALLPPQREGRVSLLSSVRQFQTQHCNLFCPVSFRRLTRSVLPFLCCPFSGLTLSTSASVSHPWVWQQESFLLAGSLCLPLLYSSQLCFWEESSSVEWLAQSPVLMGLGSTWVCWLLLFPKPRQQSLPIIYFI